MFRKRNVLKFRNILIEIEIYLKVNQLTINYNQFSKIGSLSVLIFTDTTQAPL